MLDTAPAHMLPAARDRPKESEEVKPASRAIAKAVPARKDGFHGQFALPGLVPDLVVGPDGKPVVFDHERAAENAAARALVRLYNSRTQDQNRVSHRYRHMAPAELALALDKISITPTYFAELYGVPQHRVMKWIDGEQDVPHAACVLVQLIEDPAAFARAEEITRQMQRDPGEVGD